MFFKKEKPKLINGDQDITISNYLTDALLVFDSQSRVVLANPKAEVMFEVSEKKLLGKNIMELGHYDRLNSIISFLGAAIKPIKKQEIQISDNLIVEVTSVPISEQGERANTLVIIHDITREKLSDKMKSEFVTLAAHQLRTPTSAIKWSLQGLLQGDYGELNEDQKSLLQEAYSTNDKVIELVRDLLDVAQIEEGKYLNRMALKDIEEVIKSLINSRKQEILNKKIHLKFENSEVPKIMLDTEKIKIAISNILDNALRYTQEGGEILIKLNKVEKEIEIKVIDNGIGIPENEQARVFTKFYRGSNAIKRETEGTGLGLYIVKNIIEAHGGRVWFKSKENKGTTFCIILPIKERFGEFLTGDFY